MRTTLRAIVIEAVHDAEAHAARSNYGARFGPEDIADAVIPRVAAWLREHGEGPSGVSMSMLWYADAIERGDA